MSSDLHVTPPLTPRRRQDSKDSATDTDEDDYRDILGHINNKKQHLPAARLILPSDGDQEGSLKLSPSRVFDRLHMQIALPGCPPERREVYLVSGRDEEVKEGRKDVEEKKPSERVFFGDTTGGEDQLLLDFSVRMDFSRKPSPLWLVSPDVGGTLSRRHCAVTLFYRRDSVWDSFRFVRLSVIDMGSVNGTALNDVRLLPHHRYVLRSTADGLTGSGSRIAHLTLNPDSTRPVQVTLFSFAARCFEPERWHPFGPRVKQPCSSLHSSSSSVSSEEPQQRHVKTAVVRSVKGAPRPSAAGPSFAAAKRQRSDALPQQASLAAPPVEETAVEGPPRKTALPPRERTPVPPAAAAVRRVDPALHEPPVLVIATTGMRLTAGEAQRCKQLCIEVNPNVPEYSRLTHFVIDPPLIRSVKFMCAVTCARHIVHRTWLDAVLTTGNLTLPTAEHAYQEPITRRSIQHQHGFSLERLLTVPLETRQRHFRCLRFFVHPDVEPSDPPNNDMRDVIRFAGGTEAADIETSDVLVLPTGVKCLDEVGGSIGRSLRRLMMKQPTTTDENASHQARLGEEGRSRDSRPLMVTTEEIFCSLLTQQRMLKSSVLLPSSCNDDRVSAAVIISDESSSDDASPLKTVAPKKKKGRRPAANKGTKKGSTKSHKGTS
jgi:hypothetical protein